MGSMVVTFFPILTDAENSGLADCRPSLANACAKIAREFKGGHMSVRNRVLEVVGAVLECSPEELGTRPRWTT